MVDQSIAKCGRLVNIMSLDPQYHNLIASLPDDLQTEKQQWLHYSCGGNLQIGSDAMIRCEKCTTQKPAISWFVTMVK